MWTKTQNGPLYRQSLHNKVIHKWPLSARILSCELERLYIRKMKNGFWDGVGSLWQAIFGEFAGDTKGPLISVQMTYGQHDMLSHQYGNSLSLTDKWSSRYTLSPTSSHRFHSNSHWLMIVTGEGTSSWYISKEDAWSNRSQQHQTCHS